MNRLLLSSLLLYSVIVFVTTPVQGQPSADSIKKVALFDIDTLLTPTPVNLAMFVDRINVQIKRADLKDGEIDRLIELEDKDISQKLTEALLIEAPKGIIRIQNINATRQQKIAYLRALENRMRYWNSLPATASNAAYIKQAADNFNNILKAISENNVLQFINDNQIIVSIDNSELLNEYPEIKAQLYESVGKDQPGIMINRLPDFANEPYADPIITAAAKIAPATILKYALSTGNLGKAVRRSNDPYVKTIVAIADQSPNPQKVLPFVDEIYAGTTTLSAVNTLANNPVTYFKALVNLEIKGTGNAGKTIEDEINYRGLQFVRVANELHESPAAIRFKGMTEFDARDLYFMMIGSQDEIYTSSFIWMFNRIMEKMKPVNGFVFLEKVHKNHFRTFIRMAAGYNELSDFLASMEENQKNTLMKEFVSGLEKGPIDDLEDAVDVADAFGSLTDPKLIAFLKDEIKNQYEQKINKKGTAIYSLLYTIFSSSDKTIELNEDLKNTLPPIAYVPLSALKDKDGKIVQQVFFYGDKDGMGAFNGYLNLFRNGKWKIETGKYWATVTALGKVPIVIYVNVPLPEKAEENDVFAQGKLQSYIDENQLKPSIIIHRGHSYYLPSTLEHLTPAAKIVILGSCGGYHNLAKVLDASPDANIISSKQVGAYRVNTPIIKCLNDILLSGDDVNWIDMWANLSKYFAAQGSVTNDLFSDYIPPNKNLGAIFIKAYRKQITNE